ncbi:MAG TPA: hypothetical protein VNY09_03905 [Candidatus Sulfotelmatobacter sp.]|jgi:hypothetical protein|nr:hypothetical protein [Candidatus Sulfotelmatobacter sp.]
MRRSLTLAAASTLALIFSLPAHGQDSPSLGDLARQAQKDKDKDKANKPAAKVFTNDNMPSGGASAVLGAVLEGGSGSAAPGQAGANASPAEKLAELDRFVDQVATVDRATLVRNVLKEKSNVDFPGRAAWEQRLFTARDTYVLQARAVLQKARQILASADSLKGSQDPNDPRVKEVNAGLQAFARDAVQTDAGFVAVINEGRDLASLPSAH